MKIEFRVPPRVHERLRDGTLNFHITDASRGVQAGDVAWFREWDENARNVGAPEDPKGFTSSPDLTFVVGHVAVLDSSRVVFGLLPAKKIKS